MAAPANPPQGPQGPTEQELRELVMRSDQVRQQLAAMEAQREYLVEVTSEARRSLNTVEYLTNAQPGETVLMPLGSGAFVQASVPDPRKLITNLGSGVHAELTATEAAARLKSRVENLDGAQQQLSKDIARLSDELDRANAILEAYTGASYGGA